MENADELYYWHSFNFPLSGTDTEKTASVKYSLRLMLLFSPEYCSRTSGKDRAITVLGAVHMHKRQSLLQRDCNLSTKPGEDKQLGRARGNFGVGLISMMSKGTPCFPLHLLSPSVLCAQPCHSCPGSGLPQEMHPTAPALEAADGGGEMGLAFPTLPPIQNLPGMERKPPLQPQNADIAIPLASWRGKRSANLPPTDPGALTSLNPPILTLFFFFFPPNPAFPDALCNPMCPFSPLLPRPLVCSPSPRISPKPPRLLQLQGSS